MIGASIIYESVLRELKHEYTTTITPDEFNHHINIGVLEWVKFRYAMWEQHQKNIDDLAPIKIITDGVAGMPNPLPNEGSMLPSKGYVTLPQDYLYLLSVGAVCIYYGHPCKKDGTPSKVIAATYLPDDRLQLINDDYYSSPMAEFPRLYYDRRGNVLVFHAGTSALKEVHLSYLRYPTRVEVDDQGNDVSNCEFGQMQANEIVKWCVASYLEKIEEQRQQSALMLLGMQDQMFSQPPISSSSV